MMCMLICVCIALVGGGLKNVFLGCVVGGGV